MTEPIIETRGLTKRFGRFTAVDHITLSVMPGEIFGFLGANGAGKTTAMRMLCGLSRPTEGWGRVAGCDITRQPEAVKRHIGYLSQRFSLYDDLTELARRTDELTGSLGMEAERRKRVAALPLGLKQRLAFSVAMLHRPPLVFLDEPTGGVDPVTRRAFWEMIDEAAAAGTTVFVTTHYMDEAEYCHRVSVMVDGQIRALDTPERLKQQFGATTMEDVFIGLAQTAKRSQP